MAILLKVFFNPILQLLIDFISPHAREVDRENFEVQCSLEVIGDAKYPNSFDGSERHLPP